MAQGDLTNVESRLHTAATSPRHRSRPNRYGRTEWPWRREGFNLAVYQNASPVFVEPIYNTALLRAALESEAPD